MNSPLGVRRSAFGVFCSFENEFVVYQQSLADPGGAIRAVSSDLELAEIRAQKRGHPRSDQPNRRARIVDLRLCRNTANARLPRRSELHLVHLWRSSAA